MQNIGKLLIPLGEKKLNLHFCDTSLYDKVGLPKVVWKEVYQESNRKSYQKYEITLKYNISKLG